MQTEPLGVRGDLSMGERTDVVLYFSLCALHCCVFIGEQLQALTVLSVSILARKSNAENGKGLFEL